MGDERAKTVRGCFIQGAGLQLSEYVSTILPALEMLRVV